MIDVHFVATPNGMKIAIALAELGVEHRLIHYDTLKGDHLTPAFRAINPNCRLPAIVDHDPPGGPGPFNVFESGAILLYLAEKTGKLIPSNPQGRSAVCQWLIWQMAGLGPMHGQAHHFLRYAPEGQEYGVRRYLNEACRLMDVLESRLGEAAYLAGDYSIADIAVWPWVYASAIIGMNRSDYPHIQRWFETVGARPAVKTAIAQKNDPRVGSARVTLTAEEWSNIFGDNARNAVRR